MLRFSQYSAEFSGSSAFCAVFHLNPEFAEKQQQQAEINELKTQVNDLTVNINNLMQMNKDLIAQLKHKQLED